MQSQHALRQAGALASFVLACTFAVTAKIGAEGRSKTPDNSTPQAAQRAANAREDAAKSGVPARTARADTTLTLNGRKYDLAKSDDMKAFIQDVKALHALSKEEKAERKGGKDPKNKAKPAPTA